MSKTGPRLGAGRRIRFGCPMFAALVAGRRTFLIFMPGAVKRRSGIRIDQKRGAGAMGRFPSQKRRLSAKRTHVISGRVRFVIK
jgi:hypothetical protein